MDFKGLLTRQLFLHGIHQSIRIRADFMWIFFRTEHVCCPCWNSPCERPRSLNIPLISIGLYWPHSGSFCCRYIWGKAHDLWLWCLQFLTPFLLKYKNKTKTKNHFMHRCQSDYKEIAKDTSASDKGQGGRLLWILHFTFVHWQHCIQSITAWSHH